MRRFGSIVCVAALTACGGGGGAGARTAGAMPAAAPSTGTVGATRSCMVAATGSEEIYIAYHDHIAVYQTSAQNGDCPTRTIDAVLPANVWGIAIGNGTIYVLERSAANSPFSQVLMYDAAASGAAAPGGQTVVRNDGSGGIAYVAAIPAVFETGHDPNRPIVQSFPPNASLQNGNPQQARNFTGGGGPLAVAPDGTVYAGVGAGANVYAPTAADAAPFGSPQYAPAQPVRVVGDTTTAGNLAQGIALAPDGTLYVASAPAAHPSYSTIAVYPPGAGAGTAPSRTIAIPGQVASIALDSAGELLVLHGAWLDVYAPGGSVPSRSVNVTPADAGPSSLALGP